MNLLLGVVDFLVGLTPLQIGAGVIIAIFSAYWLISAMRMQWGIMRLKDAENFAKQAVKAQLKQLGEGGEWVVILSFDNVEFQSKSSSDATQAIDDALSMLEAIKTKLVYWERLPYCSLAPGSSKNPSLGCG